MKTDFSTVEYHSKIKVVFKNGYSHELWVKDIVFDEGGQIGWEHIYDHNEFLEFVPDEILCIARVKYKKVRSWHIFKGSKGIVSGVFNGIKTLILFVLNGIKKTILGIGRGIKKVVVGIGRGIKKVVVGIFKGINRIILGIFNGIKKFFLAIWNGIKFVLNKIWTNFKRLYFIIRKIRQMITKARRKLFGIR